MEVGGDVSGEGEMDCHTQNGECGTGLAKLNVIVKEKKSLEDESWEHLKLGTWLSIRPATCGHGTRLFGHFRTLPWEDVGSVCPTLP